MGLRAVQPTFADHAARAERNRRLHTVIAGAQGIARGIDERQNTFLLIVAQVRPHQRRRHAGEGGEADHDLPR